MAGIVLNLNKRVTVFLGGPGVDAETLSWIIDSHPDLTYKGKEPIVYPVDHGWNSHPADQIEAVRMLFDESEGLWNNGPWMLKCFSPFVLRSIEYYSKRYFVEDRVMYISVKKVVENPNLDLLLQGSSTEMRKCFKLEEVSKGNGLEEIWESYSSPMSKIMSLGSIKFNKEDGKEEIKETIQGNPDNIYPDYY